MKPFRYPNYYYLIPISNPLTQPRGNTCFYVMLYFLFLQRTNHADPPSTPRGGTRDRDAGPDAIIFSATVLDREMRGFWAGSALWGSGGASVDAQRCRVKLAYLACCAHDRCK